MLQFDYQLHISLNWQINLKGYFRDFLEKFGNIDCHNIEAKNNLKYSLTNNYAINVTKYLQSKCYHC